MKFLKFLFFVLALVAGALFQSPKEVVWADNPDGENLDSSLNYCDPGMVCDPSLPPAQRAQLGGPAFAMHDPLARHERVAAPEAKGGPDSFGYKWNDNVPFSWIDATNGVDTGMSGYGSGQKVGPIPLPFKFKYYENTFKNVFITATGFITFDNPGSFRSQGRVPNPLLPNNVIAPYWTPTYLSGTGRIYYKSGGTKPNRFFVIEWHDLRGADPLDSTGADELYRFEVVLHENGQILFQYDQMSYNSDYYCGTAGIEDSLGADGLTYVEFCRTAPSQKAVKFTRPNPAARVGIFPLYQGSLVGAGEMTFFEVPIRNTGDLGTDTFDLTTTNVLPMTLFMQDGVTPLGDTDADSIVDTGPLKAGKTSMVVVRVETPGGALAGDYYDSNLTATSSLNPAVNRTTSLRTATPSEFAQVFANYDNAAMSLDFVDPSGQDVVKVTGDNYYGYDPAIVRSPNGNFLYTWQKGRCVGVNCNNYVSEIEYRLQDENGQPLTGVKKVRPLGAPSSDVYQWSHGLGVTSNAKMGISLVEERYNPGVGYSDNVWFAILDTEGKAIKRVNVTKNTISDGSLWFYNSRIVGTSDNRFVVVWQREMWVNGEWVNDIFYAVYDETGGVVKPATKYTKGGGGSQYLSPTALRLAGGSVLIAFTGYSAPNQRADLYFGVIDSSGGKVKGIKNLTQDSYYDWYYADAAQLSNNNILLAWNGWDGNAPEQRFVMLDSSFNTVAGPTLLNNPAAILGDGPVSIAPDDAGNAILTWHDREYNLRRNLYYALVDGSGNVKTPPTIFQTSSSRIDTSSGGHGNTMR